MNFPVEMMVKFKNPSQEKEDMSKGKMFRFDSNIFRWYSTSENNYSITFYSNFSPSSNICLSSNMLKFEDSTITMYHDKNSTPIIYFVDDC